MQKRIAVYGGSFNPVHIGHMMVASWVLQTCGFDEVWLLPAGQNPLKAQQCDATPVQRAEMLEIAVAGFKGIKINRIEYSLPRPGYTIDTLDALRQEYPDCSFTLVIGSDNLEIAGKWKRFDDIVAKYGVVVYPRPGYEVDKTGIASGITAVDAPTVDLSSTLLRKALYEGVDMTYFLPAGVYEYIKHNGLYR